jgi:hypothetical protein
MRLSGVRDGDMVPVNDGLTYLALVRGCRGRRLLVAPLTGSWNPAPVKDRPHRALAPRRPRPELRPWLNHSVAPTTPVQTDATTAMGPVVPRRERDNHEVGLRAAKPTPLL